MLEFTGDYSKTLAHSISSNPENKNGPNGGVFSENHTPD
jgi:hypothetical protein